jgi:hypothetical protein
MLDVYYTERWYNMDRYGLTSDDSGVLKLVWNSLGGEVERMGGREDRVYTILGDEWRGVEEVFNGYFY